MALDLSNDIVYKDKFLALHANGTLVLYKFYFPTAFARHLHIQYIESIIPCAVEPIALWKFKFWGVLPSWIYWTLDWRRGKLQLQGKTEELNKDAVIFRTSEGLVFHVIGSTVERLDEFLNAIERMGVNVVRQPRPRRAHAN